MTETHLSHSQLIEKARLICLKSRFLANELFVGEYSSAFKGSGMEFDEVREYVPGDDIRRIDWNVTARMQKPYLKTFREERERTVILMVDVSRSLNFGFPKPKKTYASEIAALLAYVANQSQDRVGMILFSDHVEKYIPARKGLNHVYQMVITLLEFEPKAKKTNLAGALAFLKQVQKQKAYCFILSDFIDTIEKKQLASARYCHELIAILLYDAFEENLPAYGVVTLRDLETDQILEIDLSSDRKRHDFFDQQKKWLQEKSEFFLKQKIDFLSLKTDQNYFQKLMAFFNEHESKQSLQIR